MDSKNFFVGFLISLISLISLINCQKIQLPANTRILTAPRGIITTPNYDGKSDYPGNQEVNWLIFSRYEYVINLLIN